MKPTPKVAAGGIAGIAAGLLVVLANRLGLDLPAEAATGIVAIAIWGASFLKRDVSSPPKPLKP